jgi:hypothetical protein
VPPKPDAAHNGCDMKTTGYTAHTDTIAAALTRIKRDDMCYYFIFMHALHLYPFGPKCICPLAKNVSSRLSNLPKMLVKS